jgi:hypothetical protein
MDNTFSDPEASASCGKFISPSRRDTQGFHFTTTTCSQQPPQRPIDTLYVRGESQSPSKFHPESMNHEARSPSTLSGDAGLIQLIDVMATQRLRKCLNNNQILRLAFTIFIAGAVTTLIAGGLVKERQEDGYNESNDNAHLGMLAIGFVIFMVGAIFLMAIWMYRTNSWPNEFVHYYEGDCMVAKTRRHVAMEDIEASYEMQRLEAIGRSRLLRINTDESFGSQGPLLPRRPEQAHTRFTFADSTFEDSEYSFESGLNDTISVPYATAQSSSPPRTLAIELQSLPSTASVVRPSKFTEELDMEIHEVDPETGIGKPKRQSLVAKIAKRFSGGKF